MWLTWPFGPAGALGAFAATVVVCMIWRLVGQGLNDALNPRLRVGHLSVRRFRLRPLRGRLDSE